MAATSIFTISKANLTNITNKTIPITVGLATALLLHSLPNNVIIVGRSTLAQIAQTRTLTSSARFL
jgi:hypothetical protein